MLRPIPHLLANQYVKARADLWLDEKFLTDLAVALLDRQSRNLVKVAQEAREVPERAKAVKKGVIDSAQKFGALAHISKRPLEEVKAAIARALKQLGRDDSPEGQERLAAYQALSKGSLGLESLAALQDEVEDAIEKIKNFRAARQEKTEA